MLRPVSERHPLLYQVNTRILLTALSRGRKGPATLDDIPEAFLADLREKGFAWIWFMGIWQTGKAARDVSRAHPGLRGEFTRELPDFRDGDICGSPFAIAGYRVHDEYGGNPALARLRDRMHGHGMKLMADFVVNHCAPDHPWTRTHPEFFIEGKEADLRSEPGNWIHVEGGKGTPDRILACGRDPYFPGWPDTLQLNLRHPHCRKAMIAELAGIARLCDGVRCDMAMLAQPDIFARTWGERSRTRDGLLPVDDPFWPAAIAAAKAERPGFLFIAEVYWDREAELQREGFDYTYDKALYDRLRAGSGSGVREHLERDANFQSRSLRFLENHDEPRAAEAFPEAVHRAAAVVAYFQPGMRFFQDGQLSGRRYRTNVHLRRRRAETDHPEWEAFYRTILSLLGRPEFHQGGWKPADLRPAWEGNPSWNQYVAFTWSREGAIRLLGVVNYGGERAQCYAVLEGLRSNAETLMLRDLLGKAVYARVTSEMREHGMYFDLPAWGYHLFEVGE